jgi:hypothetical protein
MKVNTQLQAPVILNREKARGIKLVGGWVGARVDMGAV